VEFVHPVVSNPDRTRKRIHRGRDQTGWNLPSNIESRNLE
jgi:hypothetical protein